MPLFRTTCFHSHLFSFGSTSGNSVQSATISTVTGKTLALSHWIKLCEGPRHTMTQTTKSKK